MASARVCSPFFINSSGNGMGILESLNKYSYCGCAIGKVTPFGLSFKVMNICSKRFLFLLLNLHKATYRCVDIRVAVLNRVYP